MHNNPECLIVRKCHIMALVPHPPTPPLPFVEPSLPSSTEFSPLVRNRITSPRRGHAVAMPGWTLLERVRVMGHAVWLPKPPPRGCNVRARNPDSPRPDTHAHEGQRYSSSVNMRDCPLIKPLEQDAQAASAALLDRGKGYAQHEQQAGATALGTPQHPPPSCLPFQRPQPCRADKHARVPPNPCASRTSFSPGEWCNPGTSLALCPACAPLEPSWKTQTKQGEKQWRKVVHWHTPTVHNRHQRPSQQAQACVPCGLLWGQSETLTGHPKGSPLGGCQSHAWRAQMRSQTGSVDAHAEEACVTASSTTRDWHAMLGHAFPIDDGTTTPSFSPNQVPTNVAVVLGWLRSWS